MEYRAILRWYGMGIEGRLGGGCFLNRNLIELNAKQKIMRVDESGIRTQIAILIQYKPNTWTGFRIFV
ncbi:hypothetical protein KIH39_09885 [Telmatocola sphagniphila]|uniref:Uncharacterized protein n=1 Tax=Telmatocola sphagniphila TaxID=1123043 RepID=A0A8E6EZX9_9BACT|nr:hypothetical protein [Telmatocola sphagniphila]QVL34193.1 hypothetical protein KIH39_09885 [Telmatocola sphagniphila]